MTKNQLVDQCKALIAEAYTEATEMIVAYLEAHPNEARQPLCKEIDPDNWKALESRVMRLAHKRRSASQSAVAAVGEPDWRVRDKRDAKRLLRDPEHTADILSDPEVRKAVEAEIAKDDASVRRVVNESSQRHEGPREATSKPKPTIDYDEQFQDAGATVVYRLTDWQQGKWEPNERSQFVLHFLRRAVNDPTPSEAQALVDEITTYLEGVDLR